MKQSSQQKKRWIMVSAVGLAVLLLAYYLASPWVALARFKADAQARRTDRMSHYIDFAAVRASIKAQLLARLQEEMPADAASKGWANVGMALAGAALEPAVYVLASPQGLVAMMNGENPLPGFDRLGIAVPPPVAEGVPPASSRVGPSADAARDRANQVGRVDQSTTPQAKSDEASSTPAEAKRPWRVRYEGLNRAVIQRQPAQAGDPYLLMHRRGLFAWQVVDVNLGRLW